MPECRRFFTIGLLLCLATLMPAVASDELPRLSIGSLESMQVRAPAGFMVTGEPLTLQQARAAVYTPLTVSDLGQGISAHQYWLRFALANDSDAPVRWILHQDTAWLDNLRVYYRDIPAAGDAGDTAFEAIVLSDRQVYRDRLVDYRNLAFPHTTAPGMVTEIYLAMYFDKPDSISLNVLVHEEQAFLSHVQRENLLFGIWYGVLLVIGLGSLALALMMRQIIPVYYALFLAATLMMWATLNGVGFQYLWPESVFLHNEGTHIGFLLFSFFAFQFSRHFLRTPLFFPRTNRLMLIVQWLLLSAIVLRLLGSYLPVLVLAYVGLAATLVLPVVGAMAWRRGMRHARWYIIAWLVYSSALIAGLLAASTSLIGAGMMTVLVFAQAGSFMEVLLLMLAMGERVLQIDRDRRVAVDLARKDPLTGLGNRRQLVSVYDGWHSGFRAGDPEVFVILVDLDNFKEVNDVYSHEAGDKVLQDAAMLMRRCCRPEDVCVRYGGDEFLILLQAADATAAWQIAERLRLQFHEQPTVFRGHLISHTLSGGIIRALSDREKLSVAQMLSRVDEMLYRAKSDGRNQISMIPAIDTVAAESYSRV